MADQAVPIIEVDSDPARDKELSRVTDGQPFVLITAHDFTREGFAVSLETGRLLDDATTATLLRKTLAVLDPQFYQAEHSYWRLRSLRYEKRYRQMRLMTLWCVACAVVNLIWFIGTW